MMLKSDTPVTPMSGCRHGPVWIFRAGTLVLDLSLPSGLQAFSELRIIGGKKGVSFSTRIWVAENGVDSLRTSGTMMT
ncbi:hypothetical protein AMJ39_06390 [candidate division TA06 bacterium DG_24]|uniref:Uncharacterized protein n=3 Tax=Bacteria division TA06 TaxID=1156500 RepID=A0A0S8J8M0_UNCT6|nr:MAG: hypothetical protein AMJ39_06390 [candidate division TA06 bacterium DG_24]KPK69323.1 MAG: hypothetical protein AMJ82_05940 [candidate division TA06 bacterium SM23_40]KPL05962.1 MAG: hypothetical protein AMJ71_10320 [candidate division TA06 bacterium SM1_40]